MALNRAIAIGELRGSAEALAILDSLPLDEYHLLHAARAEMLQRLERYSDAIDAYDRAMALTANTSEQELLRKRRQDCLAAQARS